MVIMDPKEKECCSYEEMSGLKKCCADCKTTKTPLWRGGPNGPKTLCNACGIRYRKRRGSCCTVGMNKGRETERERKRVRGQNGTGTAGELSVCLRKKLVALGEEVNLLNSVMKKERRKKLGEEEQAAVCLMALSSGFLFA